MQSIIILNEEFAIHTSGIPFYTMEDMRNTFHSMDPVSSTQHTADLAPPPL